MPGPDSAELETLQAVRLAGFAGEEMLAKRARRPLALLRQDLGRCADAGHIEQMSFAATSGWILTETGSERLAVLLEAEVGAAGARAVLEAVLQDFEEINGEFVEVVSRWQLRATEHGGHGAAEPGSADLTALTRHLSALGEHLEGVLDPAIEILPRFERYPAQYTAALARARTQGLRWITGVGILSCHVVWAELHQDLLSSLGRDRMPGRG